MLQPLIEIVVLASMFPCTLGSVEAPPPDGMQGGTKLVCVGVAVGVARVEAEAQGPVFVGVRHDVDRAGGVPQSANIAKNFAQRTQVGHKDRGGSVRAKITQCERVKRVRRARLVLAHDEDIVEPRRGPVFYRSFRRAGLVARHRIAAGERNAVLVAILVDDTPVNRIFFAADPIDSGAPDAGRDRRDGLAA